MTSHDSPNVFVIISNEEDRLNVKQSLKNLQFNVQEFAGAEDFLSRTSNVRTGCVVSSLRMPGVSGLELQSRLREQHSPLPVILLSRRVSTQIVVRAMRQGVTAVIDLPVNEDELWLAVREAVTENSRRRDYRSRMARLGLRFSSLSQGELDVLSKVCEGLTNKQIAALLDVSVRTVESRKRRLLEKTQSGSLAELLLTYQQFKDLNEHGVWERRPQSVGCS